MKVLTRSLAVVFLFLLPFAGIIGFGSLSELQADDAATKAQRQSADLVREALQREVYGLEGDRQDLLAAALSVAPNHPGARWQNGFVRSAAGDWTQAGAQLDPQRQAILALYQEARLKRRDTPADQLALADWCAQHGLMAQATAHLLRVVELEPDHAVARERLGFIRQGLEWTTPADQAREQARTAVEQAATAKWTVAINALVAQTHAIHPKTRRLAREELLQIRDPLALPALESILGTGGEEQELLAVEITAQMTDPAAARALARQAVMSDSRQVRNLATEKLSQYDENAFVPLLVAAMYTPVSTQYRATTLRNGRIAYHHEFTREGLTRLERLVVDADYRRAPTSFSGAHAKALAYNNAAQTAQQWEQGAAQQNYFTRSTNERIATVLGRVTGADLPPDPRAWWSWWTERNEVFVAGNKPIATIRHLVSFDVADRGLISTGSSVQESMSSPIQPRYDCFAAGTPVWTEQGQVPIERVQVGDLVLSRDVETGELAFKPVVRTTIRPAGQLIRTCVGSESLETSTGHLFWVSGAGWVRARHLETGMVLHAATGPVRITKVSQGQQAQTYNLVVADFNTYFVGQQKVLSHDNTVHRPTTAIVPGLKHE